MSYQSTYTGAQVDALLAAAEALGVVVTVDLEVGEGEGDVTGLGLAFTPTKVVGLTVEAPDVVDPLMISAYLIGAPTSDGFHFSLSGVPDAVGYKLHFQIAP